MGSISTWHVTPKPRCAGGQGRWTSTPGTIQNSMRQSISALPPMSMDLHTPTKSDYDYTVRSVPGLSSYGEGINYTGIKKEYLLYHQACPLR